MQYLSPRHSASAAESQSNLNLLSPSHLELSPSSRSRSSGGVQRSDCERSSLSSLPPYSGAIYAQASEEAPAGPPEPLKCGPPLSGHSNSDSGRSSSKSTGSGSISGRGQPLSDSGSSGRSPGPTEGYEGVVRDLEDKLRERELELQQLRDNLDENEAAICQVGQRFLFSAETERLWYSAPSLPAGLRGEAEAFRAGAGGAEAELRYQDAGGLTESPASPAGSPVTGQGLCQRLLARVFSIPL